MVGIGSFFDSSTMSVHLRENNYPYAKRGSPGNWSFDKIWKKKLSQEEVRQLAQEIMEDESSFIESERQGSTILQKGDIRVVIVRPPFSDAWEITAAKPVRFLKLEDYSLPEKLLKRIKSQAEGILVAGSPGQGKTTFARALAIFYSENNKVVKTIESPRDLILPESITQLSASLGSPEEIRDILLLSRPDYTIFDEMRDSGDFSLFCDLRLSGVGMVGIVHATKPVDSVQRFISRLELGMIPHIIDTVIFIKKGQVDKVFTLEMQVKVPAGMSGEELARPVVCINDFETGKPEFEIYSFGEQTSVIEMGSVKKEITPKEIEKRLGLDSVKVEKTEKGFILYISEAERGAAEAAAARLMEEEGIILKTETLLEKNPPAEYSISVDTRYISLAPSKDLTGKDAEIFIGQRFLMLAKIGKKNKIKIGIESDQGKEILLAIKAGKKIILRA